VLSAIGFFARATLAGLSGAAGFTVEAVRVEGTRYLDPALLLASARPEHLNASSVRLEDLEALGQRIAKHPLIERVAVRRSLPASVIIEVEERVPVAFLCTTPVSGVDADGEVLEEIEPVRYGSLPFVSGLPEEGAERAACLVRSAAVIDFMRENVPRLLDQTSEIQALQRGEIALILMEGGTKVRLQEERLEESLPLVGALVEEGRRLHADLGEVDLRFAGSVIYRQRNGSR
jgi:cell division protein FtsQ